MGGRRGRGLRPCGSGATACRKAARTAAGSDQRDRAATAPRCSGSSPSPEERSSAATSAAREPALHSSRWSAAQTAACTVTSSRRVSTRTRTCWARESPILPAASAAACRTLVDESARDPITVASDPASRPSPREWRACTRTVASGSRARTRSPAQARSLSVHEVAFSRLRPRSCAASRRSSGRATVSRSISRVSTSGRGDSESASNEGGPSRCGKAACQCRSPSRPKAAAAAWRTGRSESESRPMSASIASPRKSEPSASPRMISSASLSQPWTAAKRTRGSASRSAGRSRRGC